MTKLATYARGLVDLTASRLFATVMKSASGCLCRGHFGFVNPISASDSVKSSTRKVGKSASGQHRFISLAAERFPVPVEVSGGRMRAWEEIMAWEMHQAEREGKESIRKRINHE